MAQNHSGRSIYSRRFNFSWHCSPHSWWVGRFGCEGECIAIVVLLGFANCLFSADVEDDVAISSEKVSDGDRPDQSAGYAVLNLAVAPKKGLAGCVGQALMSNAGSLLLDGAGVALTFSPLAPEAKVLGAIALGAASTVVGAVEANTTSTKGALATAGAIANIFGIQTAPLELAQEFAQFSRGAGKALTAVGVGADVASVYLDTKTCLGN